MNEKPAGNILAEAFAASQTKPKTTELVVNHDGEHYLAFQAKDRSLNLDIRCGASGFACVVGYSPMMILTYNRKTYTECCIVTGATCITIKGERLRLVVDSLKQQTCSYIQAFDPTEFAPQYDPAAPFIESILVEMHERQNAGQNEG